MSELRELTRALPFVGADTSVLDDARIAHVAADGNHILSHRDIPGVRLEAEETADGILGRMTIASGVRIETPIHLCFGLLQPVGVQRIRMTVTVEASASAGVLAHCLFPMAREARHEMEAELRIGEGAVLRYAEGHYHGPQGGMTVLPKARIRLERGARYFSDFALTTGRVGRLVIDYIVEAEAHAVAELTAKVFGRGEDDISIRETVMLKGEESHGLIKTRVAVQDSACAEVTGITEAQARGARGHVDCKEVIRDHAVARAIPIVKVTHPEAKVTHEAAIGSVDRKELDTLMAHGLAPEEAVELIVSGILQ